MSIENLKKILESEREEYIKKFDNSWIHFDNLRRNDYLTGHKSATNRLLPLLKKAVEMATFYGNNDSWLCSSSALFGDSITAEDYEENSVITKRKYVGGKKAREFLSEFTKLTDIKRDSE